MVLNQYPNCGFDSLNEYVVKESSGAWDNIGVFLMLADILEYFTSSNMWPQECEEGN